MRRQRLTSAQIAVGLLAILVALCGCASSRNTSGPLSYPPGHDSYCAPRAVYSTVALGVLLPISRGRSILIQRITPIQPSGVAVEGYSLMPLGGTEVLLFDKFPPIDQFPDGWANREQAIRHTVTAKDQLELVAQVASTAPPGADGTLNGFVIDYESDGVKFSATAGVHLRIKSGTC